MKVTMLMGVLVACGSGGDGVGEIETAADAPWTMDGADSFLWQPDGDNNGAGGSGVLVIGTTALDCASLRPEADLSKLAKKGSGLFFTLGYSANRSADSALPAWNGLYLTGGGIDQDDSTTRDLTVMGWNKNGAYSIAGIGGGEAWVRVDQGRDDTFRGDFDTAWWDGSFDAKACPASAATDADEEAEDTGAQ